MEKFFQFIIRWGFYSLIFLTPLTFNIGSYELFEYNKMMLVYGLTVVIIGAWIGKMISQKKIIFKKSYLDLPIILFLASHILSTVFSIDQHVSIWGYYTRFHEGLLATISYILLYYCLISNLGKKDVFKILYFGLASAAVVSLWGWLEHEGKSISCTFIPPYDFNVSCWVQDVKSRVFATLGQPNWMGAYLDIIILSAVGLALIIKKKLELFSFKNISYYLLICLFFAALLFTRSRSSVIGLGVGIGLMFIPLGINWLKKEKLYFADFKIPAIILGIIVFISLCFGLPFDKLDKLTFANLLNPPKVVEQAPAPKPSDGYIDIGISTSGDIRKIVWRGAVKVWQRYPIFGSGVETFALSYYQDRPIEHNYVSEWDFLYNKAHNEFLNILATTGTVGIFTYLLILISFSWWTARKTVLSKSTNENLPLIIALWGGYATIAVTNFFGFSVVIVGVYFYLIPGLSLLLLEENTNPTLQSTPTKPSQNANDSTITLSQISIIVFIFLVQLFLLISLFSMWLADKEFALGKNYDSVNHYGDAEPHLLSAVQQNPNEPTFKDELSFNHAVIASYLWENATKSGQPRSIADPYIASALSNSDQSVSMSPNNVLFWKTRTKVMFQLAPIDSNYLFKALEAISNAVELAPTDPKVRYNQALVFGKLGQTDNAIRALKETIALKNNYPDPRLMLARYYKEQGKIPEALEQLNFILTKIGEDENARFLYNSLNK